MRLLFTAFASLLATAVFNQVNAEGSQECPPDICTSKSPWNEPDFCDCCEKQCNKNVPCDPKFGCQDSGSDPTNTVGITLIALSIVGVFIAPVAFYKLNPTRQDFSSGVLDD